MSSPNSQKIGNVTPESVNNDSQEASTQNRINNSFILQGTGNSSVTLPANTANPFNNTQAVVGVAGPANTLTVGTVTAGSGAEVTITGNSPNQVINFVLPQASIPTTNVSGVYGNASTVPAVTFNIYGQATAVSGIPIAIQANQISGGNLNSGLLLSGSIHTTDIASGTIRAYNIASGVIPSSFALTSGIVESGNIGDGAVNTTDIASGSVTYTNMASGVFTINGPAVLGVYASGYSLEGIYPNAQGTSVLVHNRSNFPPISYEYMTFIGAPDNATSLFYVYVGGNSSGVTSWNVLSSADGSNNAESGSSLIRLSPDGTLNFTNKINVNQLPLAIPANIISGGNFNSGLLLSGSVFADSIASGTVQSYNLASGVRFQLSSGIVQSGSIDNVAINSINIASGAIISGLLASGAIQSGTINSINIASGAINNRFLLASGVVNSGHIASGVVNSVNIASGAITTVNIASGVLSLIDSLLGRSLLSGTNGPFFAISSGNGSGASFTSILYAPSANSGCIANFRTAVNSGVVSGGPIQQWGENTSGSRIAIVSDFLIPPASGNTDRWYLRFSPNGEAFRSYRIGTYDAGGAMLFVKSDTTAALGFLPDATGVTLYSTNGDMTVNSQNGNLYLAGNNAGGAIPIYMGRRKSDSSNAVGANVQVWTVGSQTTPALQVNNPGSAVNYSFAVMASGQVRTNQIISGQILPSSIVGKMPIYDSSGIFRGFISLTES